MSAIIFEDEYVHYEVMGCGSPVIFIPSWVGSWRYWIPSMQSISNRYRAYAIDLWGFGDTSKKPLQFNVERQVRLIAGFIEKMRIREVTLVGHGLGGIVATYFAADNLYLTKRLMAVSFPMGANSINTRLLTSSAEDLATWLFNRSPEHTAAREDAVKASISAIGESITQFMKVDWRQLILRTRIPSLWIHGGKDPVISLPPPEQFHYLPAGSQHHIFRDAGHHPMLDEPSQFNRLLADFLLLESGDKVKQLQIKEEWKRRVR
jgi:3-oxoadipate enol-lactonase